jgi:hypothetical protein
MDFFVETFAHSLHIKINRVVFEWNVKNDVAAKWKFFDWPDLSKKSLIIQEKSKVCFFPAASFLPGNTASSTIAANKKLLSSKFRATAFQPPTLSSLAFFSLAAEQHVSWHLPI